MGNQGECTRPALGDRSDQDGGKPLFVTAQSGHFTNFSI
jgi:hypothetical protein